MKICFPILEDLGLKSIVNTHFGSARLFLLYDPDADRHELRENQDLGHAHGQCQPLKALQGETVDVVIVGGIGMGALLKLQAMGIRVLKAEAESVEENLARYRAGTLCEMDAQGACASHGGCGGH